MEIGFTRRFSPLKRSVSNMMLNSVSPTPSSRCQALTLTSTVCYEKPFYHRLESEAKDTRRQAELRKEEEQVEEDDDQDDGNESQSSEAPIEITDKVKINLMGPFGLISATVQPHVTAGSLCKYYLKKTANDKALLDSLRINLDGEMLGPDTTVEDMDVDAGDQIDVVQI